MQSLTSLRNALDKKEISAVELTQYYLDRIALHNKTLNCYISYDEEKALAQAKKAQERIDRGESMPLTGIPISLKDNICTMDFPTACGSKMLEDFVPPYNATVVTQLKEQDCVILGKTNMDEFAMGSSSQTSYFGGVKNPFDTGKVPGGSSGGAAVSVAADLCAGALGSDTGGSIRQPAAFCGITGLKPTYGAVSRYGLVAFASSFDQIGTLAHSAQDCGILLDAITHDDPNDTIMQNKRPDSYLSRLNMPLKGICLGLPMEFFDGVDSIIAKTVMQAVKTYEKLGCMIQPVSLPTLKYAVAAYYLISSAEASSNLSRYDGIKFGYRSKKGNTYAEVVHNTRNEGFGIEVKRRILLGNYALSSGYYDAYYKKALEIRDALKAEYAAIFEVCHGIITPTTPTTAYDIGQFENDPVKMYLADISTVTANIAGLPALSTPCGYDAKGLPIGMSLVGRPFDEATLLGLAYAFEQTFTKREVSL